MICFMEFRLFIIFVMVNIISTKYILIKLIINLFNENNSILLLIILVTIALSGEIVIASDENSTNENVLTVKELVERFNEVRIFK